MPQNDYTAAQAAAYLRLSRRSITYYIGKRRLAPDYTIGKSYMFSRATLDTFKHTMKKAGRPLKIKAQEADNV